MTGLTDWSSVNLRPGTVLHTWAAQARALGLGLHKPTTVSGYRINKKGNLDGLLTMDINYLTGPPNTQVTDGLRIQQPVIDPTLAQRLEGRTLTENPEAMPVTLQQT